MEVLENFEVKFAVIYPDFTKNLVSISKNLSPLEIKICMCIKMSFSSRQIKNYLNISNSTISNLRSSIRKKMGLSRAQSLNNSILCI
tara:strand:+ start:511 stop:771 length:261 start_codon:yes stop_codon:yes gene_type:complete